MFSGVATTILLFSLGIAVLSSPLGLIHLRQLPPVVQVTWVTSLSTTEIQETMTIAESLPLTESATSMTPIAQGVYEPLLYNPSQVITVVSDVLSVTTATDLETLTDYLTSTVWNAVPTVTITATPSAATVTDTEVVTVSQTFIATPGSFWSTPKQYSDLGSFKISHFADGEDNLQVMNSLPPNVSGDVLGVNLPTLPALESINDLTAPLNNAVDPSVPSDSVLQILYPAKSVNPDSNPVGGADFYATPIPLDDANNITLEYSVFFPPDFNWMQGGKLPGLYGGHMVCSGGDDATSCFSTRLMWRDGGKGELYLYAPKDKQTSALCHTPPQSICDADYGLSIGRGAFAFSAGNWTTVRQTVSLNTPGRQDGGFKLEVNGQSIMERSDIFYRDVPSSPPSSTSPYDAPTTTASASLTSAASTTSQVGALDPILGSAPILGSEPLLGSSPILGSAPLLGGALQGNNEGVEGASEDSNAVYFQQTVDAPFATVILTSQSPYPQPMVDYSPPAQVPAQWMTDAPDPVFTEAATQVIETILVTSFVWPNAFDVAAKVLAVSEGEQVKSKPIGFTGLFFSTFFGGNSPDWATPTNQYTWFKDFAITINS